MIVRKLFLKPDKKSGYWELTNLASHHKESNIPFATWGCLIEQN